VRGGTNEFKASLKIGEKRAFFQRTDKRTEFIMKTSPLVRETFLETGHLRRPSETNGLDMSEGQSSDFDRRSRHISDERQGLEKGVGRRKAVFEGKGRPSS